MLAMFVSIGIATPSGGLRAQDSQAATTKAVGTVKSVSGKSITLAAEGGGEIVVLVQDGARLLRIEPGEKDMKDAAAALEGPAKSPRFLEG